MKHVSCYSLPGIALLLGRTFGFSVTFRLNSSRSLYSLVLDTMIMPDCALALHGMAQLLTGKWPDLVDLSESADEAILYLSLVLLS